jgi:hypothetical protein
MLFKNPLWITNNWQNIVSTSIKTLWPAHTLTSSKDRQIGAYSSGLTILGKLAVQTKKVDCTCFT